MDIQDFFLSGGVVKCMDRTESDIVIDMCRNVGMPIHGSHDPNGPYHGAFWKDAAITFYKVGGREWMDGVPFEEWLALTKQQPIDVEDLI